MTKKDYTKEEPTKVLAGNTVLNLIGMGVPLLVGLVAFPVLRHGFHHWGFSLEGLDGSRFGALGLVWMFVGYFSIFDMGLGRALTKLVAEKLSRGEESRIPGLFWTAMLLMIMFGVLAGSILGGLAPKLAGEWLKVEDAFRPEIRKALFIVACSMPITILNVGLVGVLEACRRFGLINAIRVPAGSFTFIGPVLVLPFTNNLVAIVAVLVVGRAAGMTAYFIGCLHALPELRKSLAWGRREVRSLLGFGGWMAVTNVVMQLMMHINRLLIGLVRSVGKSGYYMVAEEMIVRLFIFPRAWISAIFPAMVGSFARNRKETSMLYEKGMKYLLLMMFPVVLGVAVLAPEGFRLWLGPEFERNSTGVIRWLAIGVLIHSVARVPWFLIQAAGVPRRSALLHICETPIYLFVTTWFVVHLGIIGAAVAWTLHKLLDLLGMMVLANRFVENGKRICERVLLQITAAVAIFFLSAYPSGLMPRLGCGVLGFAVFYVVSWVWIISEAERDELRTMLRKVFASSTRAGSGA